jgi:hypothetical protein
MMPLSRAALDRQAAIAAKEKPQAFPFTAHDKTSPAAPAAAAGARRWQVKKEAPAPPLGPAGLRPTAKKIAITAKPPGMTSMVPEGTSGGKRTVLSWEESAVEGTEGYCKACERTSSPNDIAWGHGVCPWCQSELSIISKEEAEPMSEEEEVPDFEPLPPAAGSATGGDWPIPRSVSLPLGRRRPL